VVLGLIGSYESSWTQLRFGGDLVAATHDEYGGWQRTFVGALPRTALEQPVEDDWLPSLVVDHLSHGPGVTCRPDDGCEGWALATVASDGSRLTWAEGVWPMPGEAGGARPVELVTVDPNTDVETLRLTIDSARDATAELGSRARCIDDDGTFVVVSGIGPQDDVVLVGPGADVTTLGLPGATASLWRTAPA
jgi:hypothetical protein